MATLAKRRNLFALQRLGASRSFSGSDVISLGTISQFGLSGIIGLAWIKTTAGGTIFCGGTTPGAGPQLRQVGQAVQLVKTNVTILGTSSGAGPFACATGKWTHVAVTYDGTNIIFYVNGIQDPTTTTNSDNFNGSTNYTIGQHAVSGGEEFAGSLADVYVLGVPNSTLPIVTPAMIYTIAKSRMPAHMIINSRGNGYFNLLLQGGSPEMDYLRQVSGTVTGTSLAPGPAREQPYPDFEDIGMWAGFGGAAASTIKFRKTLSQIGGRVGTRQVQAGWQQ